MMTDKEAIECFKKGHFLHEQSDMIRDMNSIRLVLSQNPIDMFQVRAQIDIVNRKHPENVIVFNLIFPPLGKPVSLDSASDDNLIYDLAWKLDYLHAKQEGKAFEEFCKEMRRISQENLNGGTE